MSAYTKKRNKEVSASIHHQKEKAEPKFESLIESLSALTHVRFFYPPLGGRHSKHDVPAEYLIPLAKIKAHPARYAERARIKESELARYIEDNICYL